MILTKTQLKIMQVFVSRISQRFTINGIARQLGMNVSLVHRSVSPLIGTLIKKDMEQLTLDYTSNHGVLAYIEELRREKHRNKALAELLTEILEKLPDEYMIIILFGSAVDKARPSDYDILFIFEDFEKIAKREKAIKVAAAGSELELDINIVAVKSIYEMAARREQKNVLNELLNRHIILYGAENFYRLLKNARQ